MICKKDYKHIKKGDRIEAKSPNTLNTNIYRYIRGDQDTTILAVEKGCFYDHFCTEFEFERMS